MSRSLVRLFAVAAVAFGSLAVIGPVMAECSGYSHTRTTSAPAPAPAPTSTASTTAGTASGG